MLVASKANCCVANAFWTRLKQNLAEIQPENHQNVQKTHFWQKAARVNGLILNKIKSISWQNTDIHWLALKPLTTFVNIISWILSIGDFVAAACANIHTTVHLLLSWNALLDSRSSILSEFEMCHSEARK